MKKDDLDLEMQEMLKNARPLSEIDLEGLAEANRALACDPKHVASVMKAVFVNDIICAMQEQGVKNIQLAEKMNCKRQYVTSLLNKEDPRNFTLDTIVKLSMALGLRPQCITLEPMQEVAAQVTSIRNKAEVDAVLDVDWCKEPECSCAEAPVAADESYDLAA